MELIIVSGRSGSGKTVALRVLEDLGYYCVDNLPVLLWQPLIDNLSSYPKVAISIDIRNLPDEPSPIGQLIRSIGPDVKLLSLFLDAKDEALIRRYSETRRVHPLSQNNLSLAEAIEAETELLAPISRNADLRIDTSRLSVHELSGLIRSRVTGDQQQQLILVFESFGFKNGVPSDADYMFDARFLPNPHWQEELRPLNGLDKPVQDYLSSQALVGEYIQQITDLLNSWLPHLEANNRAYLTIAIGCTGGQHRSVYVAEQLAANFCSKRKVQRRHRTLEHKLEAH
ncbi:RNase adapter RapZ [Agarivorans sp. MS3-6]|uniref:RNase adapter RapZ n=1 Tax=Agarivorans sp. TSD2052 TaxID=2937286 RepID=UPI0020108333|nr:RNase adapter RapZ [Agarivorans sp. TSD2052]UPW17981.1 RNase adapter RapZ [Agarivorans sp. TSD2052]